MLANPAELLEVRDHLVGQGVGGFRGRIEHELRLGGCLVGIVDAGKALELAGAGLLVQPLGSRFSQTSSGASTKISMKSPVVHAGPHGVAVAAVGADEGGERDQAGVAEQLGHGADAADVFLAVLGRKAQAEPLGELLAVPLLEHARPGVQAVAHVVAVEHEAVHAAVCSLWSTRLATVLLPQRAQAGEPDTQPLCLLSCSRSSRVTLCSCQVTLVSFAMVRRNSFEKSTPQLPN